MTSNSNGCGGTERCGCGTEANQPAHVESNAEAGDGDPSSPDPIDGRWIDDPASADSTLPDDVRAAMERWLETDGIETVADCFAAIRRRVGNGSLAVADLCHADGETDHRGVLEGETYHFRCFYDAVLLAELGDSPVTIRTVAPDGTEITGRVSDAGEPTVEPAGATMSFGIAADANPLSTADRRLGAAYEAICPFVRAFPDRASYGTWAATVPAATIATPLADATELAGLLLE
ncbi:organomercurial lyase [Natrarchaeobius oligotrophus]|uniref:Alkylmercury lyase n=1 Tax=Natrarchaeobius chitinivorans TaxID=1679083 RepID=A0A3N6M0I9_NATCH|nr:organomercurial lyase [Natrarchaeobius chitinivorans]RQG96768.1 alkylmercury lyase [Natrarchaeobius chitinivorans]